MNRTSTAQLPEHRRRCRTRRPPARRGAVIIILLLSMILLAGLVIYVLNLGQQVNGRVVTQHSADSAAAAGAGWVARSLNSVAMNNVAMARQIALINVLDAMPLGTALALEDVQTLVIPGIEQQPSVASDLWGRIAWAPALAEGLQRARSEEQMLIPVVNYFNHSGYDIAEMTHYEGPRGRGRIWQAMTALDEMNQATLESMGVLAQINAIQGGHANLQRSYASGELSGSYAMLTPAVPWIPWRRGSFDDFERPVRQGLLPVGVDNTTTNRGPYDAVFGWRDPVGGETEGYYQGPENVSSGGSGSVPIGSGVVNDGTYVVTSREPDAYRVFGPHTWMMRSIGGLSSSRLRYSRLGSRVGQMAAVKLDYLWPGEQARSTQILDPQWITDFDQAIARAQTNRGSIRETAFLAVEIKSRYPRNHPQFLAPGSWQYVRRHDDPVMRVVYRSGWLDPREWTADRLATTIWRDEWQYEVYFDGSIGIVPALNAETLQQEPQPVYRIDGFAFAGINVGTPVEISNPYNFSDRTALPAPCDLDHAQAGPTAATRRNHLTFLAAARRSNRSFLWSQKFEGQRASHYMVAIAQAHVFNNHSWDLWTQMWHAQLEPVSGYDDWLSRLELAAQDAPSFPMLPDNAYDSLHEYLQNARGLAGLMLAH